MKKLLYLTTVLAISFSCKKEKEYKVTLPGATTTGQNTMGFLYGDSNIWTSIEHGIFFLSNQPDDAPNAACTFFTETNGKKTIQLSGSMRLKDKNSIIKSNSEIQITLLNIDLTNRNFSFDTTRSNNWVIFIDNITSRHYYNYTNNSFQLSITKLDTVQQILSGNFSGVLYKKEGTAFIFDDSLKIQSGRFDIKYNNY
jgi:hypothetical protein